MPILSKDEFKNLVKQQLLDAISYYIERQKIVAQALTDLGFDINTDWDQNDKTTWKETKAWLDHAGQIPQTGIWIDKDNNEWEYFIHGQGCRLINTRTREPIEWDAPNQARFTPDFFHENLFWQFKAEKRYDKIGAMHVWLKRTIDELIDELIREGKIGQDHSLLIEGK